MNMYLLTKGMCFVGVLSSLSGYEVHAHEQSDKHETTEVVKACSSDWDKNGHADIGVLTRTATDTVLVVLLKNGSSYQSYVLVTSSETNLQLECRYGTKIVETASADKPRKVRTNGSYLVLIQPESSRTAFYWADGAFRDLWLAD